MIGRGHAARVFCAPSPLLHSMPRASAASLAALGGGAGPHSRRNTTRSVRTLENTLGSVSPQPNLQMLDLRARRAELPVYLSQESSLFTGRRWCVKLRVSG